MNQYILLILLVGFVTLAGCTPNAIDTNVTSPDSIQDLFIITNVTAPMLLNPVFESAQEANLWLDDDASIIGLNYNGVQHAYPLNIIVWHEIINDKINDVPLVITYCPLCGSVAAFERKIEINDRKRETIFENTGKLYLLNFVFVDQNTSTLWTNVEGRAVQGQNKGHILKSINIDITSWRDWRAKYPKTEVLSQQTGFDKPYDRDPYQAYYTNNEFVYPPRHPDSQLPSKEVIIGVTIMNESRAYLEQHLQSVGVIQDTLAGIPIRIQRDDAGTIIVTNRNNGEIIPKVRIFWFAWAEYYPNTEVHKFK